MKQNLIHHAKWATDFPIARLTGFLTYSELVHTFPGLFEPITNRRIGNESASNATFYRFKNTVDSVDFEQYHILRPNKVDKLIVETGLSGEEIKILLIKAVSGDVDPRIESLIGSSDIYSSPELSYTEVVLFFLVSTVVLTGVITVLFV